MSNGLGHSSLLYPLNQLGKSYPAGGYGFPFLQPNIRQVCVPAQKIGIKKKPLPNLAASQQRQIFFFGLEPGFFRQLPPGGAAATFAGQGEAAGTFPS